MKKFGFSNNLLVITADHSTPCIKKSHSNDSVPLLVAGKEINGTPNFFDDEHCRKQKLKLKGWDVLKEFNVEN